MPVRILKSMLFFIALVTTLTAAIPQDQAAGQLRVRTEPEIPDIPGYVTLLCDLHTHTVFSDGLVWPDVRIAEAWREGLDAISITDHIEYQPHDDVIPVDHNISYELAVSAAESVGIILIKGTEITRDMPPGHFNALFITDAEPMDTEDFMDAVKAAIDQGAFVMWNHPGWRQPGEIPIWYDEHTAVFDNGWMHGMEIVNENSYYPLAHQWCIDRNIPMIGSSDIHNPIDLSYDISDGEHRPMTFVFATERSADAIKDALFAGRTAVYFRNLLIGREKFIRPLFDKSVAVTVPKVTIKGTGSGLVQVRNFSDIDYTLESGGSPDEITVPGRVLLPARKTALITVRGTHKETSGTRRFSLPFTVTNALTAPDEGLKAEFDIEVHFIPDPRR